MNLSLHSRYRQILAVVVLIIIVAFLILNSFKTWLAYSYAQGPQPKGLRLASEIEPQNPDYYFLIAYYLMEYDYLSSYESTIMEYKKALTLSPFNHNYWFYLAELLYDGGQREKALYALNQATELSPGTVSLRWRSGMLASKMGDKESVLDNLSAVIEHDPERRTKAFALLWRSVGDKNSILNVTSDDALLPYFHYLRNTNRLEETGIVFEKLNSLNYDTTKLASLYASDLIRNGKLNQARKVWVDTYGEWEGVWNGDFEQRFMNSGFDWTFSLLEGVKIKSSRESYNGDRSIMVNFDVDNDIDFHHLRQLIPVEENKHYTLKMHVKSDELITKNGLKWELYCQKPNTLSEESKPISGTNDWHEIRISFTTPIDCDFTVLRLRREKANGLNRLISGSLWIDDVSLTQNYAEPL